MTEPTRTSISQAAERGIRYGLIGVLVVGIRSRHPAAIVNALGALAASYLPGAIEHRYDVEFEPWQRVYASSVTFTHAVGMLGPYDDVWWWDHLTHTHSSSILASIVYSHARNRGRTPHTRVIAAIVTIGVLWELAESIIHVFARLLDLEPLLVNYGMRDSLLDLCFNLLGALLVLLVGDRVLGNFFDDSA